MSDKGTPVEPVRTPVGIDDRWLSCWPFDPTPNEEIRRTLHQTFRTHAERLMEAKRAEWDDEVAGRPESVGMAEIELSAEDLLVLVELTAPIPGTRASSEVGRSTGGGEG